MSSLIRCLKAALGEETTSYTLVYVDDLLVFSDTVEAHFNHLQQIFSMLHSEGFTVKLRKSQFFRQEVSFLGHVISSQGISMDEKRIAAIKNFPRPINLRGLRGFLGLVNYDSRFCHNYSDLTVPLLELLKEGVKWRWTEVEQAAFDRIKEAYVRVTMVEHSDIHEPFYIECDSSNFAMGGCLYQIDRETGNKRVIAYTSGTFKVAQLKYTVTEKELWGLVTCLRRWRNLILGRPLIVMSDHHSLQFLMQCKLKSARLSRWTMFIQEFDFLIQHRRGVDNVVADTLSRYPVKMREKARPDIAENYHMALIRLTDNYAKLRENFKNLRDDQFGDEWMRGKIQFIEGYEKQVKVLTKKELQIFQWYTVYEGLLFRRGTQENRGFKLCVPRVQVRTLIQAQHADIGHFGKIKTYNHMKSKFFWPKMQKQIRQVVAACELCQKSKSSKTSHGRAQSVLVERPGDLVCVDMMGPLPTSRGGVTQLLVVVDPFSKYVKLYALKRATAVAILNRIMKQYVPEVQKPKCILSDNATQFKSNIWMRTLSDANIKIKHISVYFPQGNITERYNREIGRLLRAYCSDQHTKWANQLNWVEQCLNNVINESTGFTAAFLQRGEILPNHIENFISFPVEQIAAADNDLEYFWVLAYDRLRSKAARRADKLNKRITPVSFNVGDKVLVKKHTQSSAENSIIRKFVLLYEGPFYVIRLAGPNSYIIGDKAGCEIAKHNVINLKPYRELSAGLP